MKIAISSALLLLISSTNAQVVDRLLNWYGPAPASASTCDSTLGHCQDKICDIVSYACAVSGPVGPQGPQGQHGPIGPAGKDGRDGYDGKSGPMGPVGPQGLPGQKGATGLPGAHGLPGPTGQPGKAGRDGVDGYPGATGAMGPMGPSGPKGEKGDMGMQGPQGPPGSAAQLQVNYDCVTETSASVSTGACTNGLGAVAVSTCPQGFQATSCNGVPQDMSPLVSACYIEGNQCVCKGCDLFATNKKYHPPALIAKVRCCQAFVAQPGPYY